ncbi:MAG: glycoside hydrolase family 105 protein [Mangrovibacterium sp.]
MEINKVLLIVIICGEALNIHAAPISKKSVLEAAEHVFDWQQQHPTGVDLWDWEYGAYYSGLADLFKADPKIKYLKAMTDMGNQYNWSVRPRPYDANVLAISHMYLDLYSLIGDPQMIDKTVYCLDAGFDRSPREPDVTFSGNRYWWNWWSWCDALFMAPPAFAKYAAISGEIKYLDEMDELWTITHHYLYDNDEHLYFRDDRYFQQKTPGGKKVFWSRGNGWVMGGLAKVLAVMPPDYPRRPFYENLFQEMAAKIKQLQLKEGYWPSSLLDSSHFGGMESSGTAFYCYALAYGINSGLIDRQAYETTVLKAWTVLVGHIDQDGRLGYVQQVGDSPDQVKADDSEAYGSGAFLMAASEVCKLVLN